MILFLWGGRYSPVLLRSCTEDPYRPGYRFTRWYADEARTTIFDFKIPITDSITLYAGWSYITPDDPDVPASVGKPDIGIWTPGDGNSVDVEM